MRLCSTIVVATASACGDPTGTGPPVRFSLGAFDTIVVNNRRPVALPVRALDAGGRDVALPIRFVRAGGDSLPLSASGDLTCTRRGDLIVDVALGELATRLFVRCRPVESVRIPGPIQFILGDPAMNQPTALPVEATDAEGRPVVVLAGTATVHDTAIAVFRGLTLEPRARGIALASVWVGDRSAAIGVHIYQRVDSLASLDTLLRVPIQQRLFAVPLRLKPGEFERRRLPAGAWMLTMLPEDDTTYGGVRLRIERAGCTANLLNTARRFGCRSNGDASVVVYRPFASTRRPTSAEYLLVRPLFE